MSTDPVQPETPDTPHPPVDETGAAPDTAPRPPVDETGEQSGVRPGQPDKPDEQYVEKLRAQMRADVEREVRAEHARGQVAQPAAVDLSGADQSDRAEKYSGWPEEGGGDLPQPWDLRSLGLHSDSRDLEQAGPAPDTVSPIVLRHDRPILTSGSADPVVHDLGRRLAELGFDNSVSRGENPFGRVDETVLAAVYAFRAAYGVEEDPSPFGGATPAGRTQASNHIGPWTWEAILRASDRAAQAA